MEFEGAECIQTSLKGCIYSSSKITLWSEAVISGVLKGLLNLNKPFKYGVICTIQQRTGAGLTTAAACYWDISKDGMCKVPWENETILCIVTVYGVAIKPTGPEVPDS